MRVLITGGAGFVGGALARYFMQQDAANTVVVFDNLRRRGSEWNLPGLLESGVTFVHGDVRNPADFDALEGQFDALIEASAESSVHAGVGNSPRYVLDTNLTGALNCLEFARRRCGVFIFLSTSRVYSIAPLAKIPLQSLSTRLDVPQGDSDVSGLTYKGISEQFSCDTYRSYYGASKLAAELLCHEYAAESGLPVVINRCGVIAGPGQFGRTDQGVFTLWVARHLFGSPLKYTGFGGKGLQVRDLLHPEDLCRLITKEIESINLVSGSTFNVGGGRTGSVSLLEYTDLCREVTGMAVPIAEDSNTASVDIPWYITDNSKVSKILSWRPEISPRRIVEDIAEWVRIHQSTLSKLIS